MYKDSQIKNDYEYQQKGKGITYFILRIKGFKMVRIEAEMVWSIESS